MINRVLIELIRLARLRLGGTCRSKLPLPGRIQKLISTPQFEPMPAIVITTSNDSLPEWSKGVDSSSTSARCVGSNPTAVIVDPQFLHWLFQKNHTDCDSRGRLLRSDLDSFANPVCACHQIN